jgi:hypothetical protein
MTPNACLPDVRSRRLEKRKGERQATMRYSRIRTRRASDPSRSACVCEEEDGFTVQVRLFNEAKPEYATCGEEVADSFETASALLDALAAAFAILGRNSRSPATTLDANNGVDALCADDFVMVAGKGSG